MNYFYSQSWALFQNKVMLNPKHVVSLNAVVWLALFPNENKCWNTLPWISTEYRSHLISVRKRSTFSQRLTPLVPPRNDYWETSTEILDWWRVITQIWAVLLIGWKFASSNQKHNPDLGGDASSVWNFYTRSFDFISRGNQRWRCQMSAVFSIKIQLRSRVVSFFLSITWIKYCCCHWKVRVFFSSE